MEDFRNENIQLHIKINELTNKLVELANEVIKLEKENKHLKEEYIKQNYESILANKRTYI
jgi:hypothetical protein